MIFLNFKLIYILFFIPLTGLGIFLILKIYHQQNKFNHSNLIKNRNFIFSYPLFIIKYLSLLLSLLLIVLALFRPQWGYKKNIIKANGIDVVFTLDVSKSMLAQDVSSNGEKISRLSLARFLIKNFVEKNPQNRYSLVIFAGEAFTTIPLTSDTNAFLTFLDSINSNSIGRQGTSLKKALAASIERFKASQKKRGRAMVLISDGGDNINESYYDFGKVVKKEGIMVFTVGIGSKHGAYIPNGQDLFGRIAYKTYNGQKVLSKLNEKSLKQIATAVNGKYFQANKENDLEKINSSLSKLQSSTIKKQGGNIRDDKYQIFLFWASILFLIYLFLLPKKIKLLK